LTWLDPAIPVFFPDSGVDPRVKPAGVEYFDKLNLFWCSKPAGMNMDEANEAGSHEMPGERGYGAWFAFWAQFVVLGLFAVIGALTASQGDAPGDYACGMWLVLGSVAVAFLRLKAWFDGRDIGWGSFLFVDTMQNLWIVIPLFTVIGLAGLFIAAGYEYGSLHDAGIALFIVSGLTVFLTLKRVFDRLDSYW
jgi:hypothetical protein